MKKKIKKMLFIPLYVLIGLVIGMSIWAYVKVQTKAIPEVREYVLTDSTYRCKAYSDMVYNIIPMERVFARCRIEGYKYNTGEELYELYYSWWDPIRLIKPDAICFYRENGDVIMFDESTPDAYLENKLLELMQPNPPIHLHFMYGADLEELLSEPIVAIGINTQFGGISKHAFKPEITKMLRQRYEAVHDYLDGK